MSLLLTDCGEGASQEETAPGGRGEERRGVGVEGVALRAEQGGLTAGLRMSVLASTEVDCLSFSLPCFLLAVTSSFRAALDSLFPMILHRRCEI